MHSLPWKNCVSVALLGMPQRQDVTNAKSDDFHHSVPARHLGEIFGGHFLDGLKFHPLVYQILRQFLAQALYLLCKKVTESSDFTKKNDRF